MASNNEVIDEVRSIAEDAKALAEALSPKATTDSYLSTAEKKKIERIVRRTETAASDASRAAKARRAAEIKKLQELVRALEETLGVPGIDASTRRDLRNLKNQKNAQLARLAGREAMDFGGILSSGEVDRVIKVIKKAKSDVARKKKVAAHLANLMKIADLGLSILRKVAGL